MTPYFFESHRSTFSTVKLRSKVTGGVRSPAAALAIVFKLVGSVRFFHDRRVLIGSRSSTASGADL
ncbi:hypothetical protein [Streptomyces violaceusniger]|uniref:hypothetical protein n=1 Tax=Streptomyces violaceusniger TaxID=68280 RepID=UPI0002DD0A47|nr:hypothetical protein [Streptomyces violaceusniger]